MSFKDERDKARDEIKDLWNRVPSYAFELGYNACLQSEVVVGLVDALKFNNEENREAALSAYDSALRELKGEG